MTEPKIELVFDRDCPNVDQARTMIREALRAVNAPGEWREWDRDANDTPEALRVFGSPTVLVNGRDVGCDENSEAEADANACRVYFDDCGCICGAPSSALIIAAIEGARVS